MAKRLKIQKQSTESDKKQSLVKIKNLTEKIFTVPLFNSDGTTKNLTIRIQGIRGQKAPTVNERQITPQIKDLVKRRFLKLIPVD